MEKEILYTTALDKNDSFIHINNAEKGVNYYCPLCKKEFILRKSGKTGKGSRRPHFAHNELTPNCTPEGVLHYSFKKMLIDLLDKYKAENKPFILNWA
jgi:competence CoiA-like predicted nuclease